jgi:uncharacterized membrane protein YqjE
MSVPETQVSDQQMADKQNMSVPALLSALSKDLTTLIQKEMELARAEVSEKISQVNTGIAAIAAGALVLFAGFLVLLDALVVGIAEFMPVDFLWLAPFIVGCVVAFIGFIMLQTGKNKLQAQNLSPSRTTHSLQQDKELAKGQLR